ncbi:hypothetical protein A6C57_26740 (plasmid) [Fibrella sp. ES10-3-2-2]
MENMLSSASHQPENSKQWVAIAHLGQQIIHELDLTEEPSILGRWMAQRIAELMQRVETNSDKNQQELAAKECTELILTIWEKRNTWPSGGPVAHTYPTLRRLFRPANQRYSFFEDSDASDTGLISRLIDLHEREMQLFLRCPNVAVGPEVIQRSREKLKMFTDQLSEEEQQALLLTIQHLWDDTTAEQQPDDTEQLDHLLSKAEDSLELIDEERQALFEEANCLGPIQP